MWSSERPRDGARFASLGENDTLKRWK
jgi:hypothetical protein